MLTNLKNVASVEFVEMLDRRINEGAELVYVRVGECYAYICLFDGCFEHYQFDLATKDYTVTYLALSDIKAYADFLRDR